MLLYALRAKVSENKKSAGHMFTGFYLRKPVKTLHKSIVLVAILDIVILGVDNFWQVDPIFPFLAIDYLKPHETRAEELDFGT